MTWGLSSSGATIAKDIRYGLSPWDDLTRFINDGHIELESDTVERSSGRSPTNRQDACSLSSTRAARQLGDHRRSSRRQS
jgi:transposase